MDKNPLAPLKLIGPECDRDNQILAHRVTFEQKLQRFRHEHAGTLVESRINLDPDLAFQLWSE